MGGVRFLALCVRVKFMRLAASFVWFIRDTDVTLHVKQTVYRKPGLL